MFYIGLDLGQSSDPTALVVVEQVNALITKQPSYHVRHIQRWPLGTPYPLIVHDVIALLQSRELKDAALVVDATGVGRAVVDLLRDAIRAARLNVSLLAITITAGNTVTGGGSEFGVPKLDLVAAVQVCLQTRRVRIARGLPEAPALERELLAFRVRITDSARETFEAASRHHDDIVLALALAIWAGEAWGNRAALMKDRELVLSPNPRYDDYGNRVAATSDRAKALEADQALRTGIRPRGTSILWWASDAARDALVRKICDEMDAEMDRGDPRF
jgi:hypothetical protein